MTATTQYKKALFVHESGQCWRIKLSSHTGPQIQEIQALVGGYFEAIGIRSFDMPDDHLASVFVNETPAKTAWVNANQFIPRQFWGNGVVIATHELTGDLENFDYDKLDVQPEVAVGVVNVADKTLCDSNGEVLLQL